MNTLTIIKIKNLVRWIYDKSRMGYGLRLEK